MRAFQKVPYSALPPIILITAVGMVALDVARPLFVSFAGPTLGLLSNISCIVSLFGCIMFCVSLLYSYTQQLHKNLGATSQGLSEMTDLANRLLHSFRSTGSVIAAVASDRIQGDPKLASSDKPDKLVLEYLFSAYMAKIPEQDSVTTPEGFLEQIMLLEALTVPTLNELSNSLSSKAEALQGG